MATTPPSPTAARTSLHLVLVPAAITLVVTLVRLGGELAGLPAPWFSKAPGGVGGSAVVGIFWLVPLFGLWFGFRLARSGDGPSRRLRALLLHAVAAAVYVGGFQLAGGIDATTHDGLCKQMLAMGGIAVVAALPAVVAWPGLARVELLYGLGARLPTAAITVAAVFAGWGTHYEKFGPHDFAGMGSGEAAMWLAFTQVVFWIPFTIIAGGLFGSLAAAFVPGRERG